MHHSRPTTLTVAKLYITERFESEDRIDTTIICENIERTRFPVPYEEDHQESEDFPGLIRAADLIGQLGDPQYHRKISSLFAEFKETGQAAKWVANLYANVFTIEHEAPAYGLERRDTIERRDQAKSVFKAKEISENDKRGSERRKAGIRTAGSRSEN